MLDEFFKRALSFNEISCLRLTNALIIRISLIEKVELPFPAMFEVPIFREEFPG
jgi:hypothetical protein